MEEQPAIEPAAEESTPSPVGGGDLLAGRQPARCELHGLALGPDGLCVRCRRGLTPQPAETPSNSWIWLSVGAIILVCLGGVTMHLLKKQRAQSASAVPGEEGQLNNVTEEDPADDEDSPATTRDPAEGWLPPLPSLDEEEEAPGRGRPRLKLRGPPPDNEPSLDEEDDDDDEETQARRQRLNRTINNLQRQQEAAHAEILMYVTPYCPACNKARKWFDQQGIAYTPLDINQSEATRRAYRAANPRGGVPTIVINGKVLVGFSPSGIRQAMKQ